MELFKKIFSKITGKKNSDIKAEVTNTLNFSYDNIAYTEDYKSIVLDEEPNVVKAIFLHKYNNKSLELNYPHYYQYEYKIKDTKKLHQEFINKGFLIELDIENNIQAVLNMMTIAELKELLKTKGLKVSGKKADLVERLLTINISKNEIHPKYYVYTLSEKAINYLEKYDFLYKLHQSTYGIELEEYIHNKNELEKAWKTNKVKFNDVCWAILNKRTLKYSFNKDYGLLRNNFYDMYVITKSEGKANLELLCNVLYIDLSGMENNNSVEDLEIMFYKNSPIAPALSDEIKKYKLSDIIDALKNVRLNLPFSYFNLNQMINIITDEYNDLIHDVEKLKNTANLPNEESEYYNYTDFSKYRF
ncbi:SAP domain-containing protein [uncultured Parvimonas sp.]|uniref:SAP domain-containing protein n=1 Tax=uncultured Parvimonas sp. TaxID=747372 RepID=UPI002599EED5|nr:SAP domain-containing protein [uncultured Parvimonas sp.]